MNKVISESLLDILNLLAADYEIQIDVFPGFVEIPDELGLLFADEYSLLLSSGVELTTVQIETLRSISSIIDRMSGRQEYWTLDALQSNQQWDSIRNLSKRAIVLFGELPQRPKMNWMSYQQGNPDDS
ncbi:MAG: hypothetical protein F6K19_48310 [Cyanothece sp. SIO1E1]|nr:hypothetical protein [Cyanothece sp. SIO1E1]